MKIHRPKKTFSKKKKRRTGVTLTDRLRSEEESLAVGHCSFFPSECGKKKAIKFFKKEKGR